MALVTERNIEVIFAAIKATFQQKATFLNDQQERKNAMMGWLSVLNAEKVNPKNIGRGINKLVRLEWPPIPIEFVKLMMLEPADVAAPDFDAAFREACRGAYPYASHHWSHKAVYHAAVRTGLNDLAERPAKLEKEFIKNYSDVLQVLDQLDPPPIAALPKRPANRTEDQKKLAARHLDKMRTMLGVTA